MRESQYRLFGFPHLSLDLIDPLNPNTQASVSSDFDDFILWKIQENDIPSTWSQEDFIRDYRDHQVIAIVAHSLIAHSVVVGESLENWRKALRFSRTNSSKTWPSHEVNQIKSENHILSECIYHKAATFPGMSGAPILGVSRNKFKEDSPSIFVIGIHIRNGVDSTDRKVGCGQYAEFNVGIKVPKEVIQKVRID